MKMKNNQKEWHWYTKRPSGNTIKKREQKTKNTEHLEKSNTDEISEEELKGGRKKEKYTTIIGT